MERWKIKLVLVAVASTAIVVSSRGISLAPTSLLRERALASELTTLNCPQYRKETKIYELGRHNPSPKNVEGLTLPGTGKTLYRGIYSDHPQYDLKLVLRGIMGEKVVVGSPMHFAITQVLRKKQRLKEEFFPHRSLNLSLETYMSDRKILGEVKTLLDCAGGDPLSIELANEYANDLMEKSFQASRRAHRETDRVFLNLKDPDYYNKLIEAHGFGNNAIDFVIGSYYDQIAGIYGPKVLVFKEPSNRTVDLCYWNLVNNGMYCDNWVDAGETDTVGYLEAKDFLGYQARTVERPRDGWGRKLYENPIDVAYYKIEYKGQRAVLVLDGERQNCITAGADDAYFFCGVDKSIARRGSVGKTPDMLATKDQVRLMGVIAKDEAIAKEIIQRYGPTSAKNPTAEMQSAVQDIAGAGYFPATR